MGAPARRRREGGEGERGRRVQQRDVSLPPAPITSSSFSSSSLRLCPQNYPDSSLKSSASNHRPAADEEAESGGRGERLGKKTGILIVIFFLLPRGVALTSSLHPSLHPPGHFPCISFHIQGIMSSPLPHYTTSSLPSTSCSLFPSVLFSVHGAESRLAASIPLRLGVNGLLWLSDVIASFSFGRMSL